MINDDIACQEALETIASGFKGYKITCDRFGKVSKSINSGLCLTSSSPIDIKWLKKPDRYKVVAGRTESDVDGIQTEERHEKARNIGNEKRLEMYKEQKVDAGNQQGIKWNIGEENIDEDIREELLRKYKSDGSNIIFLKTRAAMIAKLKGNIEDHKGKIINDIREELYALNDDEDDGKEITVVDTDADMSDDDTAKPRNSDTSTLITDLNNKNQFPFGANPFAKQMRKNQIKDLRQKIQSKGGELSEEEAQKILEYCLFNDHIVAELIGRNAIKRVKDNIQLSGIEKFQNATGNTSKFSFNEY